MNAVRNIALAALLATAFGGCTWVTPSPDAQAANIRVLDSTSVAHCQLLTKNQLTVDAKLGVLERDPSDVSHDLQTMAINQAASVGADAVAADGPAKEGKQVWGLYRCGNAATAASSSGTVTVPAAATGIKTIPYTPPR